MSPECFIGLCFLALIIIGAIFAGGDIEDDEPQRKDDEG